MNFQTGCPVKSFATLLALMRLLSSMQSFMCSEIAQLLISLATMFAIERLFSGVHSFMNF